MASPRIAVVFDNFGPYHIGRLAAASRRCRLLGVEMQERSAEYAWLPTRTSPGFWRETLLAGVNADAGKSTVRRRLDQVLSSFQPEAVAIPGWSGAAAFATIQWCSLHDVPVVLMSESQAIDQPRHPLKEKIKCRYVRLCRAALVGGQSHRDYLVSLGMDARCIFLGYDSVDNGHFSHGAERARAAARQLRSRLCLPRDYFLASGRFIAKKNLAFLFAAFARYQRECGPSAWDLVVLGDGPLRSKLEPLTVRLGISRTVHLPGFKQYHELPAYFGLAHAFVHASSTEQWGLVVNEAMASGLPVLVSKRCGCTGDLVVHGENGFLFDPHDEATLARYMMEITRDSQRRQEMARLSRERIQCWGLERFADGLLAAAQCAIDAARPPRRWFDSLILQVLAVK